MDLKRRALYNSLRMNWLWDPTLPVEPWQVDDYRSLSLNALFDKLDQLDISLDRNSFLAHAESVDTPEELTDDLTADSDSSNMTQDQVYLIVFELWRRLVTEKQSLTVFCDELDHQIFLYDRNETNLEAIQDVLGQLEVILDENLDSDIDPVEIFETISHACANDVESFLYDFITQQIDTENDLYAAELLDDFENYVSEPQWFEFLRTRLLASTDRVGANDALRKLIKDNASQPDLEFNLELLSFVAQSGDHDIYLNLVKKSIPLLNSEEDFTDLLNLAAEYYTRLDRDQDEQKIQNIIKSRKSIPSHSKINPADPQIAEFVKMGETR